MSDMTVIGYTHNLERPEFEARVRATLLESIGELPYILVSQQPVAGVRNVCVGPLGASAENILRQLQAGLEVAETRDVAVVESDTLFPAEFFRFRPARDDCWYSPEPAYIIWWPRRRYYLKHFRELIGIVNREHALRVVAGLLRDRPKYITSGMVALTERAWFHTDVPVVTIKTRDARYKASPHVNTYERDLPQWGSAVRMWSHYWYGRR
jgi:hypothetical protein